MAMQLNQILFKHQTSLAENLVQADKQVIESQFDTLYEELRETFCVGGDQGVKSHAGSSLSQAQGASDKLDKLFSEFEIQ